MIIDQWWIILVGICAIPVILYFVYLLTRIITSAAFRSWWEAKTEMEKRWEAKTEMEKRWEAKTEMEKKLKHKKEE
jgi:hypothetical protein